MNQNRYDVVIVGGGPAGLTAARVLGEAGATALVIEKDRQIAELVRTSGGTWIRDMAEHGVPESMCHPFRRIRLVTPGSEATFEHAQARACVLDVRRVYRHLAARSARAGALVRRGDGRNELIRADIVVDASGYAARPSRGFGVPIATRAYGVGFEEEMEAPAYDQEEAVFLFGRQFAPEGYAWAFPCGQGRVRVGVGVPLPSSGPGPAERARRLRSSSAHLRGALIGARTVEVHRGIVPFSPPSAPLVWNGLVRVGDAAGHASALAGEGIRLAMDAGSMAGRAIADALNDGGPASARLPAYERGWRRTRARELRAAWRLHRGLLQREDDEWERLGRALRPLSADQLDRLFRSRYSAAWLLGVIVRSPRTVPLGLRLVRPRRLPRDPSRPVAG
jgi:digeranylgeranylglycerophospholipid reductase